MAPGLADRSPNGNPSRGERGAQLVIEAAVRVLVRDGLDGLSVRRVATEADVSIGAVQHHFRTKDVLLVAAADHVTAQFQTRAEQRTREAAEHDGPVAAFLAFCLLLANAADGDTAPSVVWLWFAAKATQEGPVADAFTTGWSQTEAYLGELIGDVFPHREPDDEAPQLLALLDGLAVARAAEPGRMPATRAAGIVGRHVARLAGTEHV